MASTVPTWLRGLIIPDPRITYAEGFDATASSITQAGNLPGVPSAQDETEMVLEAVGEQQPDKKLRIRSIAGGYPGTDDARFVWRNSGEDWRGWDPPCSLSGFEFVERTTTAGKWKWPHAITLADSTVVCAVQKASRYVVVWLRDPTSGNWTEVEVYDKGSTYTYGAYPTLCALPSGRLLCFFWRENGTNNQVRMAYSDDSGANWTTGQKSCLAEPIDTGDYTPKRLRAAYLNGQICLVAHLKELATPEDQIHQWASNSLGATFDVVGSMTGFCRGYPDLAVTDGRIIMAYVTETATGSSDYPPAFRIIGSAYADLSTATSGYCQADGDPMEWANKAGGVYTSGDLALWADEDGALYVCGSDHDAAAGGRRELSVRASTDGGDTWMDMGGGPASHDGVSLWRGRDAATHPSDFTITAQRGRALMLSRFDANPGTADDSLCCMFLGGYTTVCLPQEDDFTPGLLTVAGWTVTWLPFDFPEDTGETLLAPDNLLQMWSHTNTGTATLTGLGVHLVTGNPQTERFYNPNGLSDTTSTLSQGFIALAEVKIVTNQCRLELRISDNTPLEYEVACIVSPTYIKLWDLKAGAEVDHVDTTDAADGFVQVLAHISGSSCKLWYRAITGIGGREWTLVASTTGLSSAAVNNGNRIRWGQVDDSESYWRMVCYSAGSYTEEGLIDQDNPDDLFGRSYHTKPIYVAGGTKIQAVDGPTFRNDDWDVDTRYAYGIENIHAEVAPSPRRPWRSTADNTSATIVWTIGTATYPLGSLLGLYLGECNFGVAEFWGQNAAGFWTKLADLDLRAGAGLKFVRDGRGVIPDVSGGNSVAHYMPYHILAGSRFRFGPSGQLAEKVRKIETNTAGSWVAGSTTLNTRILLESVDGTESTGGTNGEIWSKDYACVIPTTGVKFSAFKIVIPAQTTLEGYFTIGSCVIGNFIPFGREYSLGRSLAWAPDFEMVEGRTGIRSVRPLGPTRRSVEIAWNDGVDTANATGVNPDADTVLGWTAGEPVAVPADVPYTVGGLVERLQGASTPVVYLPAIPTPGQAALPVHITNREVMLYARVVSETLKVDTVLGSEWAPKGEVVRIGTVKLDEEV